MTNVILFQPPNEVGLGHMSRLAAIAQAVQKVDPSVQVPFAVAGESHSLLESYGIPYLSIPPKLDSPTEGQWSAWPLPDRQTTATSMCYSILRGLNVKLVVFDCFPSWSMIRAAAYSGLKMVLVLREMRDMRSYIKTIDEAVPLLHSVLVAHDAGTVELAPELTSKVVYVGAIARAFDKSLRKREPERRYRIVISGGGGGTQDALRFYNLAIDAVTQLYRVNLVDQSLVVTGPLFRRWHEVKMSDAVVVLPFEPDLLQRFDEADLVISFAGYNTASELSKINTKVICIPSRTPYDDQQRRAFDMSARNPNVRVFSGSTSADLARLIEEALASPLQSVTASFAAAGAIRAAEYLCNLVGDEQL